MSDLKRYYVLFILLLAGMTSYLDRQVLTILLEPIRHELSLSDSQIGFVTGMAFTVVYVTLTIPAARIADVWSRRQVIAWAGQPLIPRGPCRRCAPQSHWLGRRTESRW